MATYYIATAAGGGDDANPGTIAEPWATFDHADDVIAAGDTINVRGGTYIERFSIYTDGTAVDRITFQSYLDENPIVDGNWVLPAGPIADVKYTPLVRLYGDYLTWDDIEIENSRGRGILTLGTYCEILNTIVHHTWRGGILLYGTYGLVEDCTVYQCAYSNAPPNRGAESWSVCLLAVNVDHHTIRRCTVYNNHGEGMGVLRAGEAVIEDCEIYDNLKVQLYLDNADHVLVQRNLIYSTDDEDFWREPDNPGPGLAIADEDYGDPPSGSNRTIVNNIIIGNGSNIQYWQGGAEPPGGLKNDIIDNNTLVQGVNYGLKILASNHFNTVIENNIIYQTVGELATAPTDAELTFNYNCWYDGITNIPEADCQGANDVNDNPDLVDPEHVLVAGAVDAAWYRLTAPSPCIGAGLAVAEVTEDYWGTARGDPPEIGAHEYSGGTSTTTTLSSTSTTSSSSSTTSTSTSSTSLSTTMTSTSSTSLSTTSTSTTSTSLTTTSTSLSTTSSSTSLSTTSTSTTSTSLSTTSSSLSTTSSSTTSSSTSSTSTTTTILPWFRRRYQSILKRRMRSGA